VSVRLPEPEAGVWLDPADIVREGFRRSRVVMMNEAHSGLARCARTREIGRRILAPAWEAGARVLAMEALGPPGREVESLSPYPGQPDLKAMIDKARELGFQLHGYEAEMDRTPRGLGADRMSLAITNWREEQQAANLARLLRSVPASGRMLVWCGNSHHRKAPLAGPASRPGEWTPMGWWFIRLTDVDPFVIEQAVTVYRDPASPSRRYAERLVDRYRSVLQAHGGTAGALLDAKEAKQRAVDAVLLSLDNEMTS
jgi:hypothetical protein